MAQANKSNAEIVAEGKKYDMNTYGRLPIAMVKGEGCYIYDADGNKYLDFVAGVAVNALGHCHPKVTQAICDQAKTLVHCSNLYWIEKQVEMSKLLVENSAFDKVFFCNSGAEANEGAIKMARKYAKMKGQNERYEVISMLKSFHGRTMATLTATGQEKVQTGLSPLPMGFKYVPFNDLKALEASIDDKTCAIMLEPLQGEGGVTVGEIEYLKGVKELCNKHDLLLIYDEVQVGLGRTGKLFAYEHSGVVPDIITLAKALANGVPAGAFMASDKVAEAFKPGDHGSTFGGNPLAMAAGVATLSTIINDNIPEHVAKIGKYMTSKLEDLANEFAEVVEIRGEGLILGMQLNTEGQDVVNECLKRGLLINCTAGSVLRFVPPLIIEEKDVDNMIEILQSAMKAVFA